MRPLLSTQSLHERQDLGQLDSSGLAAVCRAWLGCHDDILLLMTGDGRITHQTGPRRIDAAAWRPLWSKASRRQAAAALAEAAAGRTARFQGAAPTEGGDDAWLDVALAPVTNDGDHGEPRVLAVLRDITLFKREDERQAQSRRLEAIGRLAGGVAHDFNNLLTVILSASEALAEAAPEGDSRHLAEVSFQAAARGAELTRRLLAFARPVARPADAAGATSDVTGAVEAASRLLQRTLPDNVRFEARAPEGLIYCRAERAELENALLNLAVNARDAMPAGGRLNLSADIRGLDRAEAEAVGVKPGDYAVFTVEDTGAGMSPETAARAVEPFFSTKTRSGGTGLGLSSVNALAVSAGGALRIHSRLGQGARIELLIPRAKAAAQPELDLKPNAQRLPAAAVLLVEDEPAVRAETARLLRSAGCTVTEAEDAEAALTALMSEAAVDLMITDMDLPFGLDGAALAEAGRALRPDLKVLFVSGGAQPAASDLLAKPFGRAALFAAVQRQLERRPSSRQPRSHPWV
jgi:signal transduction histidine kinase/ActR/RegA family two-component response regulator